MNSPPARPEHQNASQRIAGGIQKQNPNYVCIVNSYANRKAVVCRRVATHLIEEGRAEWVAADQIKLNDHPVNASGRRVAAFGYNAVQNGFEWNGGRSDGHTVMQAKRGRAQRNVGGGTAA